MKIPRKFRLFKRHKMASDEEMLDVSFPRQYMSLSSVGNTFSGEYFSFLKEICCADSYYVHKCVLDL